MIMMLITEDNANEKESIQHQEQTDKGMSILKFKVYSWLYQYACSDQLLYKLIFIFRIHPFSQCRFICRSQQHGTH